MSTTGVPEYMTAVKATERYRMHQNTKQMLTNGQDTNKTPTKNAINQTTAVAPGHKLCNNTHTRY